MIVDRKTQLILQHILDGDLHKIVVQLDPVDQIDAIFFAMKDGIVIKIMNEMVELGERLEEGTIEVREFNSIPDLKSAKEIPINSKIESSSLEFYVHTENGNTGICGMSFELDEESHSIFVGAFPFTLVFKTKYLKDEKCPEYPIEDYTKLA